jgi:hypothetical protein
MKITLDTIREIYLAKYPEFNNPERFSILVTVAYRRNQVPTLIKCIKQHKFSGTVNKYKNIGDLELWKVTVYDTTLPGNAKGKAIEGLNITVGMIEKLIDLAAFKDDLEEIQKSSEVEQLRRSVTETTAERTFSNTLSDESVKSLSVNIALALPATEGTYSEADKAFFSWFARDANNNIYMRVNENRLILVPMKESDEPQIRDFPEFWASFWKTYRRKIIEVNDQVIAYAWTLKDSIEDADLDESRLRMKVDPNKKRSIITMIHQFIPKSWMNRLCLTLNIDQVDQYDDEGKKIGMTKFFKGFNLGFYPKGIVTGNPQPPTEENWQRMLASAIPKIEINEMEVVHSFSDQPGVCAIHRIQTGVWKADMPEKISQVEHLPPTWSMFFESRLGSQKFSMLYRIAKWIVGVVDANDFSRKVLVVSGHGADGKSLFQSAVMAGFNKLSDSEFCAVLPAESVTIEGNTQNGLGDCLDARVLMVSDVAKVTEFLKNDIIKGITGGDVITCNIKYQNPVKKCMAGTKIMLCTNCKTYMADTFVDGRVSPVYFERHDTAGGDWNPQEIKAKLVEEFADFVGWCHHFAYAVECERGIPHAGDQRIWSDHVDITDVRACWEIIGTDNGGDSMFIYRRSDEESEGEEADLGDLCDDVFESAPDNKLAYKECIPVLKILCEERRIRAFNFDKQKYKVMLTKVLQRKFEGVNKFSSNGIRGLIGVRLKKQETKQPSAHFKRVESTAETAMPSF